MATSGVDVPPRTRKQKGGQGKVLISKPVSSGKEGHPLKSTNANKSLNVSKKGGEEQYRSEALAKKDRGILQRKIQKESKDKEEESVSESEDSSSEDNGQKVTEGEVTNGGLDLEKLEASESESEGEIRAAGDEADEHNDKQNGLHIGQGEEEDIPLSDVEADSDADIVPHSKLSINKVGAVNESLARIRVLWEKYPFYEHMSVDSPERTEDSIKDIYDDTQREIAFYKQGLSAVKYARNTLLKSKTPFSRPLDYFAEMVKSDEHMDKLKTKLLTEAANQKASEESKRQRKLKKFGKQVQVATLQDRAKQKRETMEKIKSLSKKRGSASGLKDDQFDVALEDAVTDHPQTNDRKRQKPNHKRMAKNAKYGFGGKKRGKRANDADSSADVNAMSSKKNKGKSKSRPGKSRRSHM